MANSQGYVVSQSMWALDAVEDFTTAPVYNSSNANDGAAGELQNDYSQCFGSSVFTSEWGMTCSTNNIESYPIIVPLRFGARLHNYYMSTGPQTEYAREFAEYAVGNAVTGTLPNTYSISAWIYPKEPDISVQGFSVSKRYNIVSFLSADHARPLTPTAGTCSVQLYLTGTSTGPGADLRVGTQTVLYQDAVVGNYILDQATSSVSISLGEWSHVLCCYDATAPDRESTHAERIKLYINGTLVEIGAQTTNKIEDKSPFYGEIHPSTGAIGNDASYNTDISTLTGSGLSAGPDEFFLNNVFEGGISEVSIFNYSLHTLDTDLPALMYNDGCPPDMSSMPVFDNVPQRPVGYYRCGGILPATPPDTQIIPGPIASNDGPRDVAGSSSWDPDVGPGFAADNARLVNAVGVQWLGGPPGEAYEGDSTFYAKGDGYPVRDVNDGLIAVADINIDFFNSGPCNSGYDAPNKSDLIAAPIYNRKHTLGSVFSVTHFGWTVPKSTFPSSDDYEDRTLTMPIPETSTSIAAWLDLYPTPNNTSAPKSQRAFANPLGNIQTCAGSAEWESGPLAGYVENNSWISSSQSPSYDTYDDYNVNMRLKNKDYSVIPEFLVSDQIEFYFNKQRGDFLSANPSQFAIKGSSTSSTSDIPSNSSEDAFYETFSNSDFLRHFSVIKQDHKGFADPTTITLKCKALMKFLPYDGFFPSERSLQIANQFSKSYGDFMEYAGLDSNLTNARFRPFLTPFFRPGIVYNTIKSGLAVDFPVYTSSYQVINYQGYKSGLEKYYTDYYALGTQKRYSDTGSLFTASWDLRIPFEATVEPEKYVAGIEIYDLEPHPSSSIDIQARWTGEGDILYKRMMHNYLAAIPEFFLPNGEFTQLSSRPESEFLTAESGTSYGMRVKLRRTMNKPRMWRTYAHNASATTYEINQDPRNLTGDAAGLRETFTMYSRPSAFGPPVAGTGFLGFQNKVKPNALENIYYNTDLYPSDSLMGINPSFTPPYYGRESWADIVWKAKKSGKVTIDEILSEATVNLWGIDTNPLLNGVTSSVSGALYGKNRAQAIWSTNENPAKLDYSSPMNVSYANAYAMQLDASFNILGKDGDRWIIEPKFETPHYNFNSETSIRPLTSASNTLIIPTNGSESVPRGMWHQFGTIETDKGVYIEVDSIPENWRTTRGYVDPERVEPGGLSFKTELISGIDLSVYQNGNFEDLSALVGFEESKKLGNTAESLTVSEAIVAVPFILEDGEKKFFEIPEDVIRRALGDLNTISSDKAVSQAGLAVKAALKGIENNEGLFSNDSDIKAAKVRAAAGAASSAASSQLDRDEDTSDKISDTIKDMVSKMKKFVLPPNMDFVNNLGKVTPFSMYIFEFEYQFSQTDLAYMWQNVAPPDRGKKFDRKEVEISHKLYANELMGSFGNGENDPIRDGLQWMVFKVKQRANTNYFSKVSSISGPKAEQFPVSYNWPYDFFSLVEFANMDAKIGFGKGLQDGSVDQRASEARENPLKVAKRGKGPKRKRNK